MDGIQTTPSAETESDEAREARLDALAEADIASGRVVPHHKIVEWLQSWGTANKLPRPKP
jgi:predicted transcriptional regulator